ncbi:MAG: ATP-binding protein [Gammaproteobacteria bacterium]|nr:ATP-binding protein [Gammaproteobacteria bacterium]
MKSLSPLHKVLSATLLTCFMLIGLLLVGNTNTSNQISDADLAQQKSRELGVMFNQHQQQLVDVIESFAFNEYWQRTPVAEWAQWLQSERPVYQAAGFTFMVIHRKRYGQFKFDNNDLKQTADLEPFIEMAYKKEAIFQVTTMINQEPALVSFAPIKNVKNTILGLVIGVELFDSKKLKTFHHQSGFPAAIVANESLLSSSSEDSFDLEDFETNIIQLSQKIEKPDWQLAILNKTQSGTSQKTILLLIGLSLTSLLIYFLWYQNKNEGKDFQLLNQSIKDEFAPIEQTEQLNNLITSLSNPLLTDAVKSIQTRLETLLSQNKTIKLENKKLKDNEDMLRDATNALAIQRDSAAAAPKLRSEFLSRMGDEITTPMKSVISMIKLLNEYIVEKEAKQVLKIASSSSRTLVDNLNNILDFSKLDAGLLKLSKSQFNVLEVAEQLVKQYTHIANEKGLKLNISSNPDVPEIISADKVRVKQVLRNLIGNAIRFTKEGEVSLYIDMINKNNKNLIRFTIKDTGVGIPPEAQKELFESLEKTTKLTNASFAGRLRLIVSKHLAELMGGDIGVISKAGEGSQFWFTSEY